MTTFKPRRFVASSFLASLVALLVTVIPLAAHAQRKSPLEDAPAIRKRVELRETRFEGGVGFGSTINQDFFHTLLVDLKLGFHLNDWLSISGMAGLGVANLQTGFQDRLNESLMDPPPVPRQPMRAEAMASMSKIKAVLAAQLEFTPFTGKYSLFGKIFAHYDFYLFGGVGALQLEAANTALPACTDGGTVTSCAVTGLKPGGNGGVGLHTFFNNWLALNIELRDIITQINPSGRDVNGDGFANNKDLSWGNTILVTGNLTVYLPYLAATSQ